MKLPAARLFVCTQFVVVAAVAIGLCGPIAVAGQFSQLVVFGDSLSDVGNIAAASFDIYPGQYYYNDRFSNGPVFVESLSNGLALGPTVRSTAGGNNFAYGGAKTSGTGGIAGVAIRDIDEQVTQFLSIRTVDPNALFLVFAGSNDLVGGQADVNVPARNLSADIGRLIAAGARNFLVPNLPLLGNTPRFNGNPNTLAQYNTRTEQFNAALDAALDDLETTNSSLEFFRLDVAALFNQALADPAAFGLTNVTDAAAPGLEPGASSYNTGQIAPNAHEYIFWDDLHPTATVHAYLAERALQLFVPPGDYNRDNAVDAADYVVWRDGLGTNYTSGDYDVWRAHFGQTAVGISVNASAAVPEPTPLILAVLACALAAPATRTARGAIQHMSERPIP